MATKAVPADRKIDEGRARNGGPHDPRVALIAVDAKSVVFTKQDAPTPVVLFEIAKGLVTGEPADRGLPDGTSGGR